jgi:DNA polymerase III delta subunit
MATMNENIQILQNRAFYMNYKIWGERINFVKNHQNFAKKLNFEQIFSKLIETDSKIKSSMIDPKVLLISLVQEISSK